MKKYLLLTALVAISTGAIADKGSKGHGKDLFEHLTEEQKKCVESHNCPRNEFRGSGRPDKEEMKAARECHVKSFEACGIEVPGHKGEKGEKKEGWFKKKGKK
ncbi:MAG: hypothetical protein FWG80_04635 [Alphaproteobacteria bacterium]|nr:hypothetical protein [Alphaproteobacteria bacterium]